MFDIGWSELLLIGVVALVVIGPKDLPKALATAGKWMARARTMAREFQSNVDDMIRQSELDELRKQVQQARSFNIQDELEKSINAPAAPVEPAKPLAVEDYATPADAAAPTADGTAAPVPAAEPPAESSPAPEAPAPVTATDSTPTEPTKG